MSNQDIVVSQSGNMTVAETVALANQIINRIFELTDEAEEFTEQARKAYTTSKNNRIMRNIVRIFSPLIAMYCAGLFLALLESIGIVKETNDILANVIGVALCIVGIFVIWKIPFNIKRLQKEAENYTCLAEGHKEDVSRLFEQYGNVIAVIPEKYRYPLFTNYLVELFETGRATTLPMAFDNLEEQIHHWYMEATMEEMMLCQQSQAEAIKQIQSSSKVSAAANVASAAAHFVELFK